MLSLTRKTDYALVALARLAEGNSAKGRPLSARQITEEYKLPLPQMMNVFKDLQRAGFVRSVRGAHGGYVMAANPDQIKLIEVIEAIEGKVRLTICCGHEPQQEQEPCLSCAITERCPITTSMRKIHDRIVEFLTMVSLEDLMTSKVDVLLTNVVLDTSTRPNV